MSGVYAIRCMTTKQLYIDGTVRSFEEKIEAHRIALRAGRGPPRLQAAWDKHGEVAFEFILIKEFQPSEVPAMIVEAVRRLRPSLNAPSGHEVDVLAADAGVSRATMYDRINRGLCGAELMAAPYHAPRKIRKTMQPCSDK